MAKFKVVMSRVDGISENLALNTLKKVLWYESKFRSWVVLKTMRTIQDALYSVTNFIINLEEIKVMSRNNKSLK